MMVVIDLTSPYHLLSPLPPSLTRDITGHLLSYRLISCEDDSAHGPGIWAAQLVMWSMTAVGGPGTAAVLRLCWTGGVPVPQPLLVLLGPGRLVFSFLYSGPFYYCGASEKNNERI